ncbi:LysR family transcriptional regulator [Kineococcus sp. SYSU DK003]|uniref:LysR family transcriptional regulator n=1 Tax=Kineococcus sp. SYSU DK003 TaxID=3383124 RepID=UPI003D7D3EF5
MPTLRALEHLVAVLDYGSLTEAARRLHTTQSALSHQLAALEREIGTPLLHRLPRGVRPTAAGRAVEAEARAALAAAAAVTRLGRAVAAGAGGRLRIACVETMTAALLAPALTVWRRTRPDVDIDLAEFSSADALAEHLAAGRADFGLAPRPSRWAGRVLLAGREEVVAVVPVGHPLRVPGTLRTPADLMGHPVVGFSTGNGLASWLDDLADAAGVRLDIAVRTRSAVTAARLAEAGLGIALVPLSALDDGSLAAAVSFDPVLAREVVVLLPGEADALAQDLAHTLVRAGVPSRKAVSQAVSRAVPEGTDAPRCEQLAHQASETVIAAADDPDFSRSWEQT